jgi:hypothetical protein
MQDARLASALSQKAAGMFHSLLWGGLLLCFLHRPGVLPHNPLHLGSMNPPATPYLKGSQFALIAPAPDSRATEFQVRGYFSDRENLIHVTTSPLLQE